MAHDLLFTNETEWYAQDLRALFDLFSEGVLADADLEVTAGAVGLSVDVNSGSALVASDEAGDQGKYRVNLDVPQNSEAFTGGGLEAADAALPRVDRIVAHAYDDEVDGSGTTAFRLEVVTGVPTAGATLANNNGIAALPSNALPLARVLIEATDVSVDPANIADDRPLASGEGIDPDLATALGDLLVATGAGAWDNLPVGADDLALFADSGEPLGLTYDGPRRWNIIGTHANRAAAQGLEEQRYVESDRGGLVYRDTGAIWKPIGSGRVVKTVTETVNNQAAIQNDDELLFAVDANEKFGINVFLICQAASATSDMRFDSTGPAGSTVYLQRTSQMGVNIGVSPDLLTATPITVGSVAGVFGVQLNGWILNGATAGTWRLRWAQQSAEATDTSVLAGSYLVLHPLD